jgi:hypothetical protein
MRQIRLTAALALALLGLLGCSAESRVKLVPVVGTVTQGGKPLANASLSFIPDQGNKDITPGTASSDDTGYYAAKWLTRTGLAPGSYKVTVTTDPFASTSAVPSEFANDPFMYQMQQGVPSPAAKKTPGLKSEFTADVTEQGGTFDFDLGRAPKPGS